MPLRIPSRIGRPRPARTAVPAPVPPADGDRQPASLPHAPGVPAPRLEPGRTLHRLATAVAVATLALTAAGPAAAWEWPSWLHLPGPAAAATPPAAPPAAPPAVTALPQVPVSPPGAKAPVPPGLPNYRAVVQSAGPAVVGITVSGVRAASDEDSVDPDDPYLRFFRGVPGFRMPPRGRVPFRGQGSGFVISADGVILTNAHVVRDAKTVTVKLPDRREFTARVLGLDPATDIAVLKVDAKGLPVVTLGDPSQLQVGDWVLAIGSPYGFEQSATQGIVSAKGRSLPGDGLVPFIQTDAAVNPGNSGGPLFDAAGRVVGINAQIWSESGGFQGLAFAIPVDVALKVTEQIVAHGKVEHARLGVVLQDLSAPLAESFGLRRPDGALVASVAPNGAAAKAGLKAGDVITAVDGRPVQTSGDVSTRVGMARPGERMKLALWRDRATSAVEAVLGAADPADAVASAPKDGQPGPSALGLAVRPLQRGELKRLGVDHGLIVEQVGGPAAEAGLQPGDLLLAINGKPVTSVEQVRAVLATKPRHVALLIARDGQQIFVPVDVG